MTNISKEMRKLMETLGEYEVDSPVGPKRKEDPLSHVSPKRGTSHVVKKEHERVADETINHINAVLSYIDKTEELDPRVRSQILLKAEELVQKLA
ncbi:hypothetical protein LCGC14_1107090 [marine sediment metagenome]|uniref:Uncharacterized protein n=1 Tax=marine sediment metagenome TaxID=412755 RepID=A0A0F9MVQ1_9ZZZZ